MKIGDVPFNQFLGITESVHSSYMLQLEPAPHHLNHIGSIHAAVLFALAEATSGAYLLERRGDRSDINGLLRRSTTKYTKPVTGKVSSNAKVSDTVFEQVVSTIDAKGKALLDISVKLEDAAGESVASFVFSWLLAKDS